MLDIIESKWLRPKVLRPPDPTKEPIVFQQMDIDHYEHLHLEGFMGPESSIAPVTRMFGVTRDGHSILCHVHGFHPYFYIYTAKRPDPERMNQFCEHLDTVCKSNGNCRVSPLPRQILRVEHVVSRSVYGYSGDQEQNYLKIVCAIPQIMRTAANVFQKGEVQSHGVYFPGQPDDRGHRLYETNIEYEIRFMVDNKVQGCSWIELPTNKYKLREKKDYQSLCQIECDINFVDFIAHPPEGDWAGVAPLRTLSFDIETIVSGNTFPQPHSQKVIQIGNMVVQHGIRDPIIRCMFMLRSCAPIFGATVRCFDTEEEMLLAWAKFVADIDPDIITGYNIHVFDFRYLIRRAKFLKLDRFPFLGRIPTVETELKQRPPPERQGRMDINIEGRIQFDLIQIMRKEYKLDSYKLNDVSSHFLQEQKDDVHYTMITGLFKGDDQTRRRLAVYCLKDALLPLKLLDKLNCHIKYMEMSRVTGVPMNHLLTRGQHFRTMTQVLREANYQKYLIPMMSSNTGADFTTGISSKPDVKPYSLYPAIILEQKLCYTTLLDLASINKLGLAADEYIRTPSGNYFKKLKDKHQTVLPQLLANFLSAYRNAGEELRTEVDPIRRAILNGRQLALKTSANSLHDFLGAQTGGLPCLEIYRSVASLGRGMTEVAPVTKRQKL